MNFWKTKAWTPLDIGCLKWSSLLVGVVVGSFFAELVRSVIWLLLIVAIVLAIKPIMHYMRDEP